MTCENFQEWISAELDVELDGANESSLWRHLSECETCRLWRRDQQTIRQDFRRWPEEMLPASVRLPSERKFEKRLRAYRIPRSWAWAAGILIVVQGAYLFTESLQPPGSPANDDLEIETIELTSDDMTSQAIEQFELPRSGNEHTGSNGG